LHSANNALSLILSLTFSVWLPFFESLFLFIYRFVTQNKKKGKFLKKKEI